MLAISGYGYSNASCSTNADPFGQGEALEQHPSRRAPTPCSATRAGSSAAAASSGSQSPTQASRRARADCVALIASRVVVVTRNAVGLATAGRS